MTHTPAAFSLSPAGTATAPAGEQDAFARAYATSIADPDAFWGKEGRRLSWSRAYSRVREADPSDGRVLWFGDGRLNVAFNAIDRHLPHKADAPALLVETVQGAVRIVTYAELYSEVCRLANLLKARGAKPGDRIALLLPPSPELVFAVLACARIGAVAAPLDVRRAPAVLAGRVAQIGARLAMATAPMLAAAEACETVLLVGPALATLAPRATPWADAARAVSDECEPEDLGADRPLLRIETGSPEGALLAGAGYLARTALAHEALFDPAPGDVIWCAAPAADLAWLSHGVFGPLVHGLATYLAAPFLAPGARTLQQTAALRGANVLCAPADTLVSPSAADHNLKRVAALDGAAAGGAADLSVWTSAEAGGAALAGPSGAGLLPMFGVEALLRNALGDRLQGLAEGRLWLGPCGPGAAIDQVETDWTARRNADGSFTILGAFAGR
jgi:acetyl-CoA synthetase